MQERLIFPNSVEKLTTLAAIQKQFNAVEFSLVPAMADDIFVIDVTIPVDKEIFFEWAIQHREDVMPILVYCLTLSLEVVEERGWAVNAIQRVTQRLLGN